MQQIPAIPVALFNNIAEMSLRDIAYVVASSFLGNEIPAGEIKQTVDYAFAADAPLVHLGAASAKQTAHDPHCRGGEEYGAHHRDEKALYRTVRPDRQHRCGSIPLALYRKPPLTLKTA